MASESEAYAFASGNPVKSQSLFSLLPKIAKVHYKLQKAAITNYQKQMIFFSLDKIGQLQSVRTLNKPPLNPPVKPRRDRKNDFRGFLGHWLSEITAYLSKYCWRQISRDPLLRL